MGDRETWKTVLGQRRNALLIGLAGAGALAIVILLLWLVPALSIMAQIGMLIIAGVALLALVGVVIGVFRTHKELQRRQAAEQALDQAQDQHRSAQEQVNKLLHLQRQTMNYAQDLGVAVQRERLRVDELDSLQRVSLAVLSEFSLDAVLNLVTETAATLTLADTASVSLLTDENRMRTHVAAYGLAADMLRGTSSPADTALHGWVIKSGDPLLVNDLDDTGWRRGRAGIRQDGKQTAIVAPLKVKGRVIGCLSAFDKKFGQLFSEHDLQLLSLFANQAAIAIENARLYEQTRRDLEMKSALIGEIQSRVRESLTAVRDLLSAELSADPSTGSGQALPDSARHTLQASIRRIQVIAQVHDLLAQRDFGPLGFGELAESIAGLVQADLDTDAGQGIELTIGEGNVWLSPHQATPVALIASELVSEAVARRAVGRIELSAQESAGQITCQVHGLGIGSPTDKSSWNIIQTLVADSLKGRLRVITEGDAVITSIRFAKEAQEPRPAAFPGILLDAEMEPPDFLLARFAQP
jgi:GAF domain-containing protein